jgi:hypothetical protein
MTAQIPEDRAHIVELLPAYVNGQLDEALASQVRAHLVSCTTCQAELANWEAVKEAARYVFAATPLPSAQVMNQVWERIDVAEQTSKAWHWPFLSPVKATVSRLFTSGRERTVLAKNRRLAEEWLNAPVRALRRLWLVFRAQIPLINRSIWITSALMCLLSLILTVSMAQRSAAAQGTIADILVLFIAVVGAVGGAFLYGSSVDPGFELTIATPTSVRLVMLCRMVIVLGYNMLLALLASAVFAALYGGGLWGFVQLWFGPMVFLTSLCLALSLFVGSTFALLCAIVIEVLQTFPQRFVSHLVNIPLPTLDLQATSPVLLIAALLLLAFALFCVPRQPRLAS